MEVSKKWYKSTWAILVLLVLFFPAGLFLMWRYSKWNSKVKWIVSGIFGLLLITTFASGGNKQGAQNVSNVTQNAPTESETPLPVKKFDIQVKSEIVKKVNGKYRYFFDIRNHDSESFEGSVTIDLFTSESKNPLAGETFNTTKAIKPSLGTAVYTDAHTGPISVHGANGLTKFTYTVKKDGKEVNKGEGQITDQYEDLSL